MRVTGDEMAKIDSYAINRLKIPGILLMENAALAMVKHIDLVNTISYTLVVGTGNNGADGLALARHLANYDHEVKVYILGKINEGNKEYMTYYQILVNMGVEIINLTEDTSLGQMEDFKEDLSSSDLVVDGIFGTGLNSNVRGIQEYAIEMINSSSKKVLSIDLPSGLSANDGTVMGVSVDADLIVSFQYMKEGLYKNRDILGEIYVENISIPKLAANKALK